MKALREKIQNKLSHLSEKQKNNFLFSYGFLESFFLILPPPDPFLIYIIFVKTKKWVRYTTILVIASVAGGFFSYIISYFFFDYFKDWFFSFEYIAKEFDKSRYFFNKNSFWAIFVAAFTPVPYTVFTIAAGVFKTNILSLISASLLGRSLRFFTVGAISYLLGKRFAQIFVKYLDLFTIFIILIIILYVLFKIDFF